MLHLPDDGFLNSVSGSDSVFSQEEYYFAGSVFGLTVVSLILCYDNSAM